MEFRVLGTVAATVSGRPVYRVRRREWLLLGILLLSAGHTVTVDRLVDLLWNESSPRHPRRALQVYASRLRAQLSVGDGTDSPLIFDSGGYRIDVDPESVDAHRFTGAVKRALRIGDPAERARLLRDALGLWRGRVLGDVADEMTRDRVGSGLEQLRLTALESCIEAELELGEDKALVAELAELTQVHPTRDRLVAARMTALHRSGRTGEAVDVYQSCVRRMREDYGLDVGDQLRRRYVAILRDDPDLRPPRPSGAATVIPAELPPDLRTFVGREPELDELCAERSSPGRAPVISVDGMAGVGKSALVVHAAHRLARSYPHGQLYLDLRGFSPGLRPMTAAEALDRMLRSFGMTGMGIPQDHDERAARYRSVLSGRRVLIILDNVVASEQVRPLIPAASGCLVLVTSRHRLTDLDQDSAVSLSPLSRVESDMLLRSVSKIDMDRVATEQIGRQCGFLPLALRVAAARLNGAPDWTPARLLRHLREDDRLVSPGDTSSAVTTAMDVSYRHLTDAAGAMLRILSLAPVSRFDGLIAAALADVSVERSERLLVELADARMLESGGGRDYRFHDLARRFAERICHRETPASMRREALRRLMHHCLATANLAGYRLNPHRVTVHEHPDCPNPVPDPGGYEAALTVLDGNRELFNRMVEIGHAEGMHEQVWRLCSMLTQYFQLRHHYDDWRSTHERGLDSARKLNDVRAQARLSHRLASVHQALKNRSDAVAGLVAADRLYAQTTDMLGRAVANNSLGSTYLDGSGSAEDLAAAVGHLELALNLYREVDDRIGQAMATTNLGRAYRLQGRPQIAVALLDEALSRFRELDVAGGQAVALHQIGLVHAGLGRDRSAMTRYRAAVVLARRAGSIGSLTDLLTDMGETCLRLGWSRQAVKHHEELAALLGSNAFQHADDDIRRMRAAIAATYRAVRPSGSRTG